LHTAERFDHVLCNPPYYAGEMASSDPRRGVAKHAEGLTFSDLADVLDKVLGPGGRCSIIIPMDRESEFLQVMGAIGLGPSRRCAVRYLEHRPAKRVLLELTSALTEHPHSSELVVEHAPGQWTEAYRTVMRDLLLKC
jgi:tRNA1Val (adenine37-N6)-methyltransferase